jgi:hypothetical protein
MSRECGERHVDPDHPGLDRARDAMAARRIAGPDPGEEAELDVVCDPNRVLLVLERDCRHDRAEDLLLRDRHRALDNRQHGPEVTVTAIGRNLAGLSRRPMR